MFLPKCPVLLMDCGRDLVVVVFWWLVRGEERCCGRARKLGILYAYILYMYVGGALVRFLLVVRVIFGAVFVWYCADLCFGSRVSFMKN